MTALLALLLTSPADACSMVVAPPDLGLPGANAGPDAVFSTPNGGRLYGPDGNEVAVARVAFAAEGWDLELLVPEAPLAPGAYTISPCDWGVCAATIGEEGGDPGVPPLVPEIDVTRTQVSTGQRADCGPQVPARVLTATTEAVTVVFSEEPIDDLAGATLLGVAMPNGDGELVWTTTWDGTVYAAAIDAEGELSEWTQPIEVVSRGCSSLGATPLGLAALLAAMGLTASRTRRRRG